MQRPLLFTVAALTLTAASQAAEPALVYSDPKPQRYELSVRASELDPQAKPHPEIDFDAMANRVLEEYAGLGLQLVRSTDPVG